MALFSFRKKAGIPTAEEALPGRAEPLAGARPHFVTRRPIKPPFPEGLEQAVFGLGCFWGAERKFWQTAGVYTTAVGYAGGDTPNPTYEEVCSGLTGHTEVVLVVFDPKVVVLRRPAPRLLGEPRPDPGHAAGQRRRHAVPLGHLHATATRSARRRRRRATPTRRRSRRAGYGPITTEIRPRRPSSTTPRTTTSSTSPRIPAATAASAAPASRAPWESPPPTSGRSIPVSRAPRGKPRQVMLAGVFCNLRLALDLPRGAVQCGWWSRS